MLDETVSLDRFELGDVAGSGGMGTVHRAIDRTTNATVAVKFLRNATPADLVRFAREVRSLASLDHPSIVRYVAHGESARGEPFLAMEWLEGEDLGQTLARAAIALTDAVAIARQLASALATAHAKGVIHRDVKPSNVFLVGGRVDQVRLLDFGIARSSARSRVLTQTGSMIGTIGYMAPEQAMGVSDLDARADVFALGCVLFECVTGRPAFPGDNVMAVLAKLLTDAHPRARSLRPDVPERLDAVIDAMLARERETRTASMSDVIAALDAVTLRPATGAPVSIATALTERERRYVGVVLIERKIAPDALAATISPEKAGADAADARAIATRFGATLRVLDAATQIVTVQGAGDARDHALRIARLALELRRAYADARLAIAGGAAETDAGRPIGDAIDRAVALLAATPLGAICVDPSTAELLHERFEIGTVADRLHLLRARTSDEGVRVLLGRPTPCVGRDKELALLASTLDECIAESTSRAVLVTAAPGTGKTRLRREFVQRALQRENVRVLNAPCDSLGGSASLSLLRALVRAAAEAHEADPPELQLAALRAHLHALPCERDDLLAFFAEMLGLRTRATPSPEIVAARGDPLAMRERLRRTFETWLLTLADAGPIVLVLEDVHWIDEASAALLAGAYRRVTERPVMTLALARPEFHDTAPHLWNAADVLEIRLSGLPRRAAERLVRSALGDDARAEVIQRVVDQADGNAFYLEELIRCVAEGRDGALPETVLALVMARLESLSPDERRALRAASVFGETFWTGGVRALLGDRIDDARVATMLDGLVAREVLQAQRPDRFAGERAYAFRHALLREGAYAMLTEEDRVAGHALAARWLESAGERDSFVLAEHYDRGRVNDRAAHWLARAARDAIDSGRLARGVQLAERGVALGATGETLGRLLSAESVAHLWSDRLAMAHSVALESMKLLPAGGPEWSFAALAVILSEGIRGQLDQAPAVTETLLSLGEIAPSGGAAAVLFGPAMGLMVSGQVEPALRLEARLADMSARSAGRDPAVTYAYHATAAFTQLCYGYDARRGREHAEASLEAAKRFGNPIALVRALATAGGTATLGGRFVDATSFLRQSLAAAQTADSKYALNIARLWFTNALWHAAKRDEARQQCELLIDADDPHFSISSRVILVLLDLEEGHIERGAERAVKLLSSRDPGPFGAMMHAGMAHARLAIGDTAGALEVAALAWMSRAASLPWHVRSIVDSAYLRALVHAGHRDEARRVLELARQHVEHIVSTIDEVADRDALVRSPTGRHVVEMSQLLA